VRRTRKSKTPVLCCSSRSCQQPTANSSQHRRPPPPSTNPRQKHRITLTAHHTIATVSASQKGLPSCPCLEIAFAPQTLGFVTVPYPKSCPVSQPAACCVLSSATHSQQRPLAFSHRANFLAGWCHRESISYSAPRLHFLSFTILSCDKVQLCDFGIFTPPQFGRLPCDSASCLSSPRLRRNTSQT
jgi:hypothetical protein